VGKGLRWVGCVEGMLFKYEVVAIPSGSPVFVVLAKVVSAHKGFQGFEDKWVVGLNLLVEALDKLGGGVGLV